MASPLNSPNSKMRQDPKSPVSPINYSGVRHALKDVADPQSPAVDAAVAVQAALKAWEVAKAASNLVPGASDAKRGNEPSHSFKDLAARGAGSSLSSSSRAPGTSGGDSGGAHLRIETSEPAGSHSSSKNGSGSNGKDKGNKQLQDIRRMLNRKEEVSKSAGRTNSLIHQFEKQSSAAGAQRYGGGGGDSSDDDACHPNPNSGYNSSTRVSRVSSFDYDDDGEEDHEGQESTSLASMMAAARERLDGAKARAAGRAAHFTDSASRAPSSSSSSHRGRSPPLAAAAASSPVTAADTSSARSPSSPLPSALDAAPAHVPELGHSPKSNSISLPHDHGGGGGGGGAHSNESRRRGQGGEYGGEAETSTSSSSAAAAAVSEARQRGQALLAQLVKKPSVSNSQSDSPKGESHQDETPQKGDLKSTTQHASPTASTTSSSGALKGRADSLPEHSAARHEIEEGPEIHQSENNHNHNHLHHHSNGSSPGNGDNDIEATSAASSRRGSLEDAQDAIRMVQEAMASKATLYGVTSSSSPPSSPKPATTTTLPSSSSSSYDAAAAPPSSSQRASSPLPAYAATDTANAITVKAASTPTKASGNRTAEQRSDHNKYSSNGRKSHPSNTEHHAVEEARSNGNGSSNSNSGTGAGTDGIGAGADTSTAPHEESEEDAAWRERDRALQEAFASARSAQAHGEESLSSLKQFGQKESQSLQQDHVTEKSDRLDFDLDDDEDNANYDQGHGNLGNRLNQQSPRKPTSASKRFSSQNDVGPVVLSSSSSSSLPMSPRSLHRRISSQNDVSTSHRDSGTCVPSNAVRSTTQGDDHGPTKGATGMSRSALRRQETLAAAAAAREAATKEAAMKRALERQNKKAISPLTETKSNSKQRPSWSTRARDGGEHNTTSSSSRMPSMLQLPEDSGRSAPSPPKGHHQKQPDFNENHATGERNWQVQAQDLEGFGALPDEFNADDLIGNTSSSSSIARHVPQDLPPEVAAAAAAVEAWAKEEEIAATAGAAAGDRASAAESSFAAGITANSFTTVTGLDPSLPPSTNSSNSNGIGNGNGSSNGGAFASFQGLSSGGKLRCDLVDLRARADACRRLVEHAMPEYAESNGVGGSSNSGYLSPGKKLSNRSGMPAGALSSSSPANGRGRSLLSPSKRLAQAQQQQQQQESLEFPGSRNNMGAHGGSGGKSASAEDAFARTMAMGMRVYQEAATNVFRDLGVVQEAAASLTDHSSAKGGAQLLRSTVTALQRDIDHLEGLAKSVANTATQAPHPFSPSRASGRTPRSLSPRRNRNYPLKNHFENVQSNSSSSSSSARAYNNHYNSTAETTAETGLTQSTYRRNGGNGGTVMAAAASALSAAGQLGDVKQGAWLQTAIKDLHSEQHQPDDDNHTFSSAPDYHRSLAERIAASDAAASATTARASSATASVAASVPKGRPARRHGQSASASTGGVEGVGGSSNNNQNSNNSNLGSSASTASSSSGGGPLFRTREGRAFAERQQRQQAQQQQLQQQQRPHFGWNSSDSRRYGGLPQQPHGGGSGSMEQKAVESGRIAERLVEAELALNALQAQSWQPQQHANSSGGSSGGAAYSHSSSSSSNRQAVRTCRASIEASRLKLASGDLRRAMQIAADAAEQVQTLQQQQHQGNGFSSGGGSNSNSSSSSGYGRDREDPLGIGELRAQGGEGAARYQAWAASTSRLQRHRRL